MIALAWYWEALRWCAVGWYVYSFTKVAVANRHKGESISGVLSIWAIIVVGIPCFIAGLFEAMLWVIRCIGGAQ